VNDPFKKQRNLHKLSLLLSIDALCKSQKLANATLSLSRQGSDRIRLDNLEEDVEIL
jgi:hypothetical protein